MENRRIKKALLVRTDRIGDLILTLPMVDVLKKNFPSIEVSMLVQEYTKELVEGQSGISSVLTCDSEGKRLPLFQLVRILQKGNFDAAVLVYPRFYLAFALWCAGIPLRIGTGYRWYSFLLNRRIYEHRKYAIKHEAVYNLSLLKPLGCSLPENVTVTLELNDEEKKQGYQLRKELGIKEDDLLVVIHPGSGGSAREWKIERLGSLAQELTAENIKVVVSGISKEESIVRTVCELSHRTAIPFISNVSIKVFAGFLQTASVVVANSTGTLHIAAAVGTPVVGFYPPVRVMSATRWGPLTEKKIIFVPDPYQCKKCHNGNCRGNDCMDQIEVEEVKKAVVTLIQRERNQG
ncbi:MAG TPA: glycosyltransferase family 9 protein [Bacteroidota bacterium]|nr:glycosyltransferase family 9 protein [Bacteroidota bacterium]